MTSPVKSWKCIELPQEEGACEEEVGLLLMSLYGTRDATATFQREVRKFMPNRGFAESKYNPTMYCHHTKDIRTLARGDLVSSGHQGGLEWLHDKMKKRLSKSARKS